MLLRAVEHHPTSTVDGTRRSLPPRLHLRGLLHSRGADAAEAGDRRCHYVFDAQGGVGLVSSIAVNVVEVRQRNLPLSGRLFLSLLVQPRLITSTDTQSNCFAYV